MKSGKPKATRKFTAVLKAPDDSRGAFIEIPFDVQEVYGTKGHVKVKALFDGYPYRGILANMGTGCHLLIVRKDIRQAIGKTIGDKISVELTRDTDERKAEIPPDLASALKKTAEAREFFSTLSYTNQKEYCVWISTAKKAETRDRRLAETITKLLAGKKNPTDK